MDKHRTKTLRQQYARKHAIDSAEKMSKADPMPDIVAIEKLVRMGVSYTLARDFVVNRRGK